MSAESQVKIEEIKDIRHKLLRPALTSHYLCNFQPPVSGFLQSRINTSGTNRYDYLSLACSEASLPGSSLATIDIDNDFSGVSEKHAYRRVYDDRADFTFYVNSTDYYPIIFFESWIAFVMNEQQGPDGEQIKKSYYSYRANYPETYYADDVSITKFERDFGLNNNLVYKFIKAYPISISSIPLAYDASTLLKCTVSFNYSRYYVMNLQLNNPNTTPNPFAPGVNNVKYNAPLAFGKNLANISPASLENITGNKNPYTNLKNIPFSTVPI